MEKDFALLGLHPQLKPAFDTLRKYSNDTILPLLNEAGLLSVAWSLFFLPLADHFVTRVDVVARAQVLSLARAVLITHTDGATDAPSVALLVLLCGLPFDEIAKKLGCEAVPSDPVAPIEPPDDAVDLDGAESQLLAMEEEDFWAPDDDGGAGNAADATGDSGGRRKPSEALLWTAARLAVAKLSPAAKEALREGGRKLHAAFREVRAHLVPEAKARDDGDAFVRWTTLRDQWSLGAASARTKVSATAKSKEARPAAAPEEPLGRGERKRAPSRRFDDAEPSTKKPQVDPAREEEEALAAEMSARLVREQGKNIACVRQTLLSMLLSKMPDFVGLRLSPLPSKSLPYHLCESYFRLKDVARYLTGGVEAGVTLSSLFNVPSTVNAVILNGGRTFSTLSQQKGFKETATVTLKSEGRVFLDTLYGTPDERAAKRKEAEDVAKNRPDKRQHAPMGKLKPRVPVSKRRGRVTEQRFTSFLAKADEKGLFSKAPPTPPEPPPPPAAEPPPQSQFAIKFETRGELSSTFAEKMEWLKQRLIVALDPGQRWVVSGVVVRVVSYRVESIEGTEAAGDGKVKGEARPAPATVHVELEYRRLRVSGRKWSFIRFDDAACKAAEVSEAQKQVESIMKDFARDEFLRADPSKRVEDVCKTLNGNVTAKLNAAVDELLDEERVQRKDARLRHQKKLALELVRHIDNLGKR